MGMWSNANLGDNEEAKKEWKKNRVSAKDSKILAKSMKSVDKKSAQKEARNRRKYKD